LERLSVVQSSISFATFQTLSPRGFDFEIRIFLC
jgi:hypothetical protein